MKRISFEGTHFDHGDDFYDITPHNPVISGNYYFLSNDVFSLHLAEPEYVAQTVILGVANPHFFHVMCLLSRLRACKRIIAVDSNPEQLVHFRRIYELILNSRSRIDFLQRLFKVRFNAKAINLFQEVRPAANESVRGGVENDPYFPLECELWRNLTFDAESFHATYGIRAEMEVGGLLIRAETVGDINAYYATFLCGSRSDYRFWPFTAAFGSGFLKDEQTFIAFRDFLQKTPVYILHGDLSVIYPELLHTNGYYHILAWCSNLLCDYFVAKHPPLRNIVDWSIQLGSQCEPLFPEIDLVLFQDERAKALIPPQIENDRNHRQRWSVHTLNFAKVSAYIRGRHTIEVISMLNWFEQDKGISKLPNTDYMLIGDFIELDSSVRYDSVFIHILQGHGVEMSIFRDILLKARHTTGNLIILEHNRASADFRRKGIGVTVDEIRDILGMETYLDFGPGNDCPDRNIIMVYRD